jgi:transcriptional regulator
VTVLVRPSDAAFDEAEWKDFLTDHDFGLLLAAGRDREIPVAVPTHFVFDGASTLYLHLARPNPVWAALEDNPAALFVVTGDWCYIPGGWKATGDEDPALGIPTSYYASVQLAGRVAILDSAEEKLAVLRRQIDHFEVSSSGLADPSAHTPKLGAIRGIRFAVDSVEAKFKYGGNVDESHRLAVAERLALRDGPGDAAARQHLLRRLGPA